VPQDNEILIRVMVASSNPKGTYSQWYPTSVMNGMTDSI
jgi:hypothetical protein